MHGKTMFTMFRPKECVCEPSSSHPRLYNQMTAATTVSSGFYQYSPFLVELSDSTFVRHICRNIQ